MSVNVVVTVLPTVSIMISIYVPFVDTIDPLENGLLLSVAVAHERLSVKVIVMSLVCVAQLVKPKYCGGILSIRCTVAVVDQVLPIAS